MIWTGAVSVLLSILDQFPHLSFGSLSSTGEPKPQSLREAHLQQRPAWEEYGGTLERGVWFTYLFLSNENSKSIIDIIDVLLRKEDVQGGDKDVFSCPWGEGRERGRRKRREAKGLQCPISGCPLRLARPPVLLPAEAHLAAESVILITTDGELPLPLLHAGRRLLQGCGQPGVALPQGLQLNLPLLHIGSTVGVTGDGTD